MDLFRWDIALLVAVPALAALGIGLYLVRRWLDGPVARMRSAARRLGGRVDPACERARSAAILVELDGRLLRISYPVRPAKRGSRGVPPSIEICTPVENSVSLVAAVRLSDEPWALDLVSGDVTAEPMEEIAREGILIYGRQASVWLGVIVREQPSLAVLELDSRMLRVVLCERTGNPLDAAAVERLVRGFASALPGVLRAAGVSGSSARRERD